MTIVRLNGYVFHLVDGSEPFADGEMWGVPLTRAVSSRMFGYGEDSRRHLAVSTVRRDEEAAKSQEGAEEGEEVKEQSSVQLHGMYVRCAPLLNNLELSLSPQSRSMITVFCQQRVSMGRRNPQSI